MARASCAESRADPLALEKLILRGRSGNRQALKLLIERYQVRIAKFVLSQTRDANAYEDLCQAIFVKMVFGLSRLRDAERFESWLFQIARNVCRDHLRARLGWKRYFVAYQTAHDHVAAPEPSIGSDNEEQLANGLARLSSADRSLLLLHLDEKRSHEELARLSNTTVSAVKSRLYRARRDLRDLLLAGGSK
jgi:RNA polymerase sigma-70 factor (ECF subfamily)